MSMYGVNAGVPKTLVRHLVSHAADSLGGEAAAILPGPSQKVSSYALVRASSMEAFYVDKMCIRDRVK